MKKRRAILKEALQCKDIKSLDKKTFLKAWKAVAFLYPGLHADEYDNPEGGWPRRLKPLAFEAFRRYEIGEFTDNQLCPWQEALRGFSVRRELA